MDEVVELLHAILSELTDMNEKLDEIKGYGIDNSITDVCNKIDSLESTIIEDDNY